MSTNDRANLLAIVDAVIRIQSYTAGITTAQEFYDRSIVFDATLMNFVVIGEMVDRLSPQLKVDNPELDWQKIKAFRNIVAHDYLGVDAEEVWQIVQDDLLQLRDGLEKLFNKLSEET